MKKNHINYTCENSADGGEHKIISILYFGRNKTLMKNIRARKKVRNEFLEFSFIIVMCPSRGGSVTQVLSLSLFLKFSVVQQTDGRTQRLIIQRLKSLLRSERALFATLTDGEVWKCRGKTTKFSIKGENWMRCRKTHKRNYKYSLNFCFMKNIDLWTCIMCVKHFKYFNNV